MAVAPVTIDVITGPTASGKTALSLERAGQDSRIEIVNADAFQIYRGFDIGTGKPTSQERAKVLHHLIDSIEPAESYSAGQYAHDARSSILNILGRDKKPLVVGGTGLYIDALFFGISSHEIDDETKQQALERYTNEFEAEGFDALHQKLKDIDPALHEQITRERNPLRLERAWVHYYATGIPLGVARKERSDIFAHQPNFTVLSPDREELRARIEQRVDGMLAAGWVDEVRRLLAHCVTKDMPAMRAIGYRELAQVVEGSLSLDKARELIVNQTRQYAKRQITWMKRYQRQAE